VSAAAPLRRRVCPVLLAADRLIILLRDPVGPRRGRILDRGPGSDNILQETAPNGRHGRTTRSTRYLLLAVGCWLLLILPFAVPYFRVQRDLGFERTLADSEPFSASLQQYTLVPPGSVLHGLWLPSDDKPRPAATGGRPVPGLCRPGAGGLGADPGQGRARWLYAGLLLVAFCLSLGPRLYLAPNRPAGLDLPLPYAWLYAVVPGFKAMRAPVRFDALVMVALAVLAAMDWPHSRRPRRQARPIALRFGA